MNRLLDWIVDWWEETFESRRARIILAIALVLYIAMLVVFGGPTAILVGLAGLWLLLVGLFLLVSFVLWVIYGND